MWKKMLIFGWISILIITQDLRLILHCQLECRLHAADSNPTVFINIVVRRPTCKWNCIFIKWSLNLPFLFQLRIDFELLAVNAALYKKKKTGMFYISLVTISLNISKLITINVFILYLFILMSSAGLSFQSHVLTEGEAYRELKTNQIHHYKISYIFNWNAIHFLTDYFITNWKATHFYSNFQLKDDSFYLIISTETWFIFFRLW